MNFSDASSELTLESYPELDTPLGARSGQEVAAEFEAPVSRAGQESVASVQKALNQVLGLRLPVDGVLSPQTRSAIRSFQQRSGLATDGLVGPATAAALKSAVARGSGTLPGLSASTPAAAAPGPLIQPVNGKLFFGLDTASVDENPNPNWVKARDEGPITFAFFRATYGIWRDTRFAREWPRIKDAGILRGAYLFLRFPHVKYGVPPAPVDQAKAFIKTVGKLDPSDFPPALDVEFPGSRAATGRPAPQLLDMARSSWRVLKDSYGVAPMIYTSGRVWREDFNNLPAPDLIESPLWLTPYPFGTKSPAVRNPQAFARGGRYFTPPVPKPWGDKTNWWIHQYQGDAQGLPGFRQVDMNVFNTTTVGATGDRVKWVQRRLGIMQSGMFDAATKTALAAFQFQKGLTANSIIDPRTFAFLCWSNP
jgi:lysozyme